MIHTDNFKKWFGDWTAGDGDHSKVVDAVRRPVKVRALSHLEALIHKHRELLATHEAKAKLHALSMADIVSRHPSFTAKNRWGTDDFVNHPYYLRNDLVVKRQNLERQLATPESKSKDMRLLQERESTDNARRQSVDGIVKEFAEQKETAKRQDVEENTPESKGLWLRLHNTHLDFLHGRPILDVSNMNDGLKGLLEKHKEISTAAARAYSAYDDFALEQKNAVDEHLRPDIENIAQAHKDAELYNQKRLEHYAAEKGARKANAHIRRLTREVETVPSTAPETVLPTSTVKPLYHGTPSGGFSEHYDLDTSPTRDGDLAYGRGVYMSEAKSAGTGYARPGRSWGTAASGARGNPEVMPLYANIRKPFNLDAKPDVSKHPALLSALQNANPDGEHNIAARDLADPHKTNKAVYTTLKAHYGGTAVNKALRTLGHDGITHTDHYNPGGGGSHKVWIAFHANQVKHAENNNGDFSEASDMYKAETGKGRRFLVIVKATVGVAAECSKALPEGETGRSVFPARSHHLDKLGVEPHEFGRFLQTNAEGTPELTNGTFLGGSIANHPKPSLTVGERTGEPATSAYGRRIEINNITNGANGSSRTLFHWLGGTDIAAPRSVTAVVHGGKHYFTHAVDFDADQPVTLDRKEKRTATGKPIQPSMKPVTYGELTFGNLTGSLQMAGGAKGVHPVYDVIRIGAKGTTAKKALDPEMLGGGVKVVHSNGDYDITTNNPERPTQFTLFHQGKNVGQLNLGHDYENPGYLSVKKIQIDRAHRGKGYGKQFYQTALSNLPENITGLSSYRPDIVSPRVRKIHQSLGGKTEGSYTFLAKTDNVAKAVADMPPSVTSANPVGSPGNAIDHAYLSRRQERAMSYRQPHQTLTPGEHAAMQDTIAKAGLFRRDTAHAAVGILSNGFKNLFHTGTTQGWNCPDTRADAENQLFNLPENTHADHRPIYGYLHHSPHGLAEDDATSVSSPVAYGGVVFKMKPQVRKRTTFTPGDSLSVIHYHDRVASALDSPHPASVHVSGDVFDDRPAFNDTSHIAGRHPNGNQRDYTEAQYHGGLGVHDIEEMIVPHDSLHTPAAVAGRSLHYASSEIKAAIRAAHQAGVQVRFGVKHGDAPGSKVLAPGQPIPHIDDYIADRWHRGVV